MSFLNTPFKTVLSISDLLFAFHNFLSSPDLLKKTVSQNNSPSSPIFPYTSSKK
jgi:hypothetical protein